MFKKFMPDYYYPDLSHITPEALCELGIKGLVMDIDNTIVTYDDPTPTPKASAWFEEVTAKGIKISFVSNNDWDRVNEFNRELGYPAYAKSGKPFIKNIIKVMEEMGTDRTNTAFIGDQIFTDVWAGKRAGLLVFLVDPIKDKTSLFFKSKRALEIPIKKAYWRNHK